MTVALPSGQIYVVMEKMNGDMLEMILNSETSRLTERLAKFMIYQVSRISRTLQNRPGQLLGHCREC